MTVSPLIPPFDVSAVLKAVVLVAQQTIPTAAAVSVTLIDDTGARTAASSSHWADFLDEAQYDAGSGPCVDAARSGETCVMRDAAIESRWPAFVAAALARGAGSAMSVPVPVDHDGVLASLNAFAVRADGFTVDDEQALTRLAGTAAAALMTADIGGFIDRSKAAIRARESQRLGPVHDGPVT
jgi:GAF domain-containing protein